MQQTEICPYHRGIAGLADKYDAFILDLWGVVHNGLAPLPGVLDCLARLRDAGKSVLFLSNAPRSASVVVAFLDGIGIGSDCYHRIVTSGDAARRALRLRQDDWHARLGWAYYYLGKEVDAGMLDRTDYVAVDTIDAAEFILDLGLADAVRETVETYLPILESGLAAGLPMVCGNPDLIVHIGASEQACAGALAKAYEDRGGNVYWHGKPHRAVYDLCFSHLDGIPAERILAVGDSLRTDIAGANNAGLDSLFAVSGIHARDFGVEPGVAPDLAAVRRKLALGEVLPTGLLGGLRW